MKKKKILSFTQSFCVENRYILVLEHKNKCKYPLWSMISPSHNSVSWNIYGLAIMIFWITRFYENTWLLTRFLLRHNLAYVLCSIKFQFALESPKLSNSIYIKLIIKFSNVFWIGLYKERANISIVFKKY